jgi:hypothetical protein
MTTTFWPNYLFFVDMSDEAAELAAIPEGPLSASNATLLAAALSTHDTGEGRAISRRTSLRLKALQCSTTARTRRACRVMHCSPMS